MSVKPMVADYGGNEKEKTFAGYRNWLLNEGPWTRLLMGDGRIDGGVVF
jgi:hypothetical protein